MRILILATSVLFLIQVCYGYKSYYLDEYPAQDATTITLGTTTSRTSSIVLKLSKRNYLIPGKYRITVKPPFSYLETYGIIATVQHFYIKTFLPGCIDSLEIWSTGRSGTIYNGCGGVIQKSFQLEDQKGGSITFFMEIGNGLRKNPSFEITLTTVSPCRYGWTKRYSEFFCSYNKCIYNKLQCDKRDNCGNNQDEADCSRSTINFRRRRLDPWKIALIIGIIIAIVVGVVVSFCRHRSKRQPQISSVTFAAERQPQAQYVYPQTTYLAQPCSPRIPQPWISPYPQQGLVMQAYPHQGPVILAYPQQGPVIQANPQHGQVYQANPQQGQVNQAYSQHGQVNQANPQQGPVDQANPQQGPVDQANPQQGQVNQANPPPYVEITNTKRY